jgi:hypothetical protein
MKYIKTFENYRIVEAVSFNRKDKARILTLNDRATDEDHLLRLASNMADAIGRNVKKGSENEYVSGKKAFQRGLAAEDENFHEVAQIFFDRAKELGFEEE